MECSHSRTSLEVIDYAALNRRIVFCVCCGCGEIVGVKELEPCHA
jgi:hypothetical protein